MASDVHDHWPFTLWSETLPSNDAASLLIWPRSGQIWVVAYWNQEFHTELSFATLAQAEAWGHELRRVLREDALAGALLGYGRDVVSRLQAQCSTT